MKKDWIYCKDQLPKVNSKIFQCDDGSCGWRESNTVVVGVVEPNGTKALGIGVYVVQLDGKEYWDGCTNDFELRKCNVIAWQSLPKLPDPPLGGAT